MAGLKTEGITTKPRLTAESLPEKKIAHERIVRAGYRLARLLNEVFDY